ncbi:MAG TPA: DUF2752 domain-containing protein [Candidatus Sulfotelmatobacter sp.]|nr:DUF2752 domain-containing protein [Candidatus Sulfotelmatobacter sp.]
MTEISKRSVVAAALFAMAGAVVVLRMYDPASSGIFPPCPVHYLTGLYCPGCGSLRAMHQLLHGNLRAAWAMNPLTCILLPFLMYGLASEALSRVGGRGLPQVFLPAASIRVLCGVIIVFGIVRNLPMHPFDLLAPGAMLRF